MLNLFSINNNLIYISLIIVLIVIIILTILSIKKDRDKLINKKRNEVLQDIEPAKTKEEQEHAKLELEKVVNSMKNDLEKKQDVNEIKTYEQEQEEKAIISYQELVEAVRKNNVNHKPQTEIGMEVSSTADVEMPITPEEKIHQEEVEHQVDNIMDMIDAVSHSSEEDNNLDELNKEDLPKETIEEPKNETKKFHSTEFISPIYGLHPQGDIKKEESNPSDNDLDDIINNDLNNTDELLETLKKFREKL